MIKYSMYKIYLLSIVYILTILSSCGLNDNAAPLPYYLDLKNPVVSTVDLVSEDTHRITDVYVFEDNQIIGVYPLPAKIPIIYKKDKVNIRILAGVRNNGFQDTPIFYPFYRAINKEINPVANETSIIDLDFSYMPNAKISINENFESTDGFSLDLDNKPNTSLTLTTEEASLGQSCAFAILSGEQLYFEVASNSGVRAGENAGGASYLEFDYKGEGEIAVGILKIFRGQVTVQWVLFVPGKDDWNRIYVELTNKLSSRDYDEYRIAFAFRKTGISSSPKIYIDNVKHLHF